LYVVLGLCFWLMVNGFWRRREVAGVYMEGGERSECFRCEKVIYCKLGSSVILGSLLVVFVQSS
jgi:hypothetical protein